MEEAGTSVGPHLAKMGLVWMLGLIPGTLYVIFNPDGLAQVDRFSYGKWLQALKYTPIPHLASFVFGVMLANLDEMVPRMGMRRLVLGIFGFAATFAVLTQARRLPYPLLHDGFFMPLFGCIILGLAGVNPLSKLLGLRPSGVCRRGELLPLSAALQLVEHDSRFAHSGSAGSGAV